MTKWLIGAGALAVIAYTVYRQRKQEARPSWSCALHGHNDLLIFGEAGRVFLRCATCRKETPGWDLVRNGQEIEA